MKKSGQNKIIIVAGVLVVVACFFAVYLRLFTSKELWYESFAAILGVIITAVITLLLLRGQSSNDVEKERSSKIFEEKLRIYQDYLATLCDVLKRPKIHLMISTCASKGRHRIWRCTVIPKKWLR